MESKHRRLGHGPVLGRFAALVVAMAIIAPAPALLASVAAAAGTEATQTALSDWPAASSNTGESVDYTAVITPAPGNAMDTGTVAFSDGGTVITGCESVAVSLFFNLGTNSMVASADCEVTYTEAASHTITAVFSGTTTLAESTSDALTHEVVAAVSKTDQAISFTSDPPSGAIVGGTYTPAATGGDSGNPVVFAIDASAESICSIDGAGVVSFTGVGDCAIDANQDGSDTYNPAPQVQQSFAVSDVPLYVKSGATGDCSSWDNACELQTALSQAGAGDQIWVAAGTYRPAESDRAATFQLTSGVAVYGGFAGIETSRDQRDPATSITILSGDLNDNDGADFANNGENSWHVVNANGTNATAVFDGFTVTAGNANGGGTNSYGGGIYVGSGSPTLTNLVVLANRSNEHGGGVYIGSGSPAISDSEFDANLASLNVNHTTNGGGLYVDSGSPTLDHVAFSGNRAEYHGGGMASGSGSPALNNVSFTGNTAATGTGGGLYTLYGSSTLIDVSFTNNWSRYYAGGMHVYYGGATLTNVTFRTNSTWAYYGGGFQAWMATTHLTNVTFVGNSAGTRGGAMYLYRGTSTLDNVTLTGNSAPNTGGLYNDSGTLVVRNSILWGDTGLPEISNLNATATVSFSDIWGSHGSGASWNTALGTDGGGNIEVEPLLGTLGSYPSDAATESRPLLPGSPVIDAANSDYCPATDQRGVARPQGSGCDMGAYEARPFSLGLGGGDSQAAFPNTFFANPLVITVSGIDGDPVDGGKITFTGPTSGSSATFGASGGATANPARLPIAAGSASAFARANGSIGSYEVVARAFGSTDSVSFGLRNVPALLYVKPAGLASGLCESWASACASLSYALDLAGRGSQVWVAEGTYLPDTTGLTDPRSATFEVATGVKLYGGFAGSETTLGARDSSAHVTILSGDLNGDDGANFANYADNAYHVVTMNEADASTILDGFTVTAGNAAGDTAFHGGGIYVFYGSPTLRDLVIADNAAQSMGGGMFANGASPALTGVTFSGNSAGAGGGMLDYDGSPTLTDVSFSGNSARSGGGMTIVSSGEVAASPALTNVRFVDNSASTLNGGGIDSEGGSPTLSQVTFSSNSAAQAGGGMWALGGDLTIAGAAFSDNAAGSGGGLYLASITGSLTNVTIAGNSATSYGGGVATLGGVFTLTNVTFTGNSAATGGAMYNLRGSQSIVTNGVLWGNAGGEVMNGSAGPGGRQTLATFVSSDVAGSDGSGSSWYDPDDGILDGGGNIDADPLLGTLGSYPANAETQTVPLLPGSAAIDAGDSNACPAADQRGVTRPQGSGCDMGAFEAQPFSLSVSGGDKQSAQLNRAFANPLAVAIAATGDDPVAGGEVTFSALADGAGATFVGNPATIESDGTATVTATANGTSGSYVVTASAVGATGSANFDLTNIARSTPAFTFDLATLPAVTYGDASFSLVDYASKPADDNGAITFALGSGSAGCSVTTSGTVTITGATGTGTCIIDASLAEDDSYLAAGPISQSFVVGKAQLTVTADDKSMVYGGTVPSATYSVSGFVNSETLATSGVTGSPSCTIDAGPYTVPGSPYVITCTGGTIGASNYSFTFSAGALTVTPATPAFTFNLATLPAVTFGDASFSLVDYASKPADDNGAITFALGSGSAGCTVTTSGTVTITGVALDAAACIVAATLAADPNYAAAGPITQSLHIARATPTFTSISIDNATYDGQPHGGTASVSGVGNPADDLGSASVSYELRSGSEGAFTYGTPTSTAPTDSGVYRVTLSYAGGANYEGISDGSRLLTINPATTAISAVSGSATYGGTASLTATLTDTSNISYLAGKAIAFKVGTADVGSATTDANGVATLTGVTVPSGYTDVAAYADAVTASFAAQRNYDGSSNTGDVTVEKAALTVTPDNASRQYSDPNPSFSGTITGIQYDDDITATYATTASASSAPGTYDITATLVDPDSRLGNYEVTNEVGTLTVTQENARAYYTGDALFWGTSADASSATVTLMATIKDITAVADDEDYDAYAGDISHATVTFVDRDTKSELAGCIDVSVALVASVDSTVGTATCTTTLGIGNDGGTAYAIGIVVGGYYTHNTADEDEVITVAAPITSYFITGGGYLIETSSAGVYAADPGRKANFGFNVKFNKGAKHLQGNVNILFRKDGHTYQIKSNALTSLGEKPSPCTGATTGSPCTATFVSKANLQDITDPTNPISLGGNLTFQMSMTDYGSALEDTIGFTLYDRSTLLFSSKWSGTRTVEQLLGGGNLSVR